MASESGHVGVVKILLSDTRVNPRVMNDYALFVATRNGHMDVANLLKVTCGY